MIDRLASIAARPATNRITKRGRLRQKCGSAMVCVCLSLCVISGLRGEAN